MVIPEQHIQDLHIPETLTTAINHYAIGEIRNNTNSRITFTLNSPLKVIPFPDSAKEKFNFFHIENLFPEQFVNTVNNEDIKNLIRTKHLNREEENAILALCREYTDIFHKKDDKLTFTNQIKHVIKTTDEVPVHTKSYRYPFVHKPEIEKQIQEMLENGIIRLSASPWSTPIWIVPKKIDASAKQKWRRYNSINQNF